ncbi:hypothetical protein HN51_044635 [Arachis hypogaea]|uniref:CCT domain-containing protein n=1 Tax=Arachis hypogaea TaxID=3818 RepID=A0A444Y031_ARAHY|nr:zinc finger protein HD1 [Arachis ipaensis]XP_025669144.1 zinc finger protein HD1-like [Arachis hypogaea]QHN96771.1 Zinc finger protein CONSTANS-LIKE [Arachis hypogaea]RYQ95288.1 hypothetical protein Ahy_B08g090395 [Arachis hypogaea]
MPLSTMASSIPHHQFYSNYTFTTDLVDFPYHAPNNNNNNASSIIMDNFAIWGSGQDCFFINNHNNITNSLIIDNEALDCDTMNSSSWAVPSFAEQLGGGGVSSDMAVPAISDCKMGFYGGATAGFQDFSSGYRPGLGNFGEECCGFKEDIKQPTYSNATRENWGIQGNQMPAIEEPNIKVGRYSEEERKERILRYLKKRNQRNFNKTIKYACRKTLADRRVRVRGRFARNNELLCEEDMATKKNENHHHHHHHDLKEEFYGGESIQFQLKNDEEDWLQEAMASLVYLSHSSPEDM